MKTKKQIIEEEGSEPKLFAGIVCLGVLAVGFILTIALTWCVACGVWKLIELLK